MFCTIKYHIIFGVKKPGCFFNLFKNLDNFGCHYSEKQYCCEQKWISEKLELFHEKFYTAEARKF